MPFFVQCNYDIYGHWPVITKTAFLTVSRIADNSESNSSYISDWSTQFLSYIPHIRNAANEEMIYILLEVGQDIYCTYRGKRPKK